MSPGHAAPKQKWTPKLTRYVPSISILSPSSFSHHITAILWTFYIDLLPTVCQTSQTFSMRLVAYLKEPTGGWRVFLGTFWEGLRTLNSWARWMFFPRAALSWREQRCRYPLLAFSGFRRSVKLLLPSLNTEQKALTQSRIPWDFRSCDLISTLFSYLRLLALLAMLE